MKRSELYHKSFQEKGTTPRFTARWPCTGQWLLMTSGLSAARVRAGPTQSTSATHSAQAHCKNTPRRGKVLVRRDSEFLLKDAVCCGRNWTFVPGDPWKTPLFQANSCLALCLPCLMYEGLPLLRLLGTNRKPSAMGSQEKSRWCLVMDSGRY